MTQNNRAYYHPYQSWDFMFACLANGQNHDLQMEGVILTNILTTSWDDPPMYPQTLPHTVAEFLPLHGDGCHVHRPRCHL